MRLEYLNEFVHLACKLSYSSACKDLNISQSTLSNHIISLEKSLGVTLIERTNPLGLTSSGRVFLEYAQRTIDLMQEAKAICQEAEAAVSGAVRILLPPNEGTTLDSVLKLANRFNSDYPNIRVELHSDPDKDTLAALRSNLVDCSLLTQQVSFPSFDSFDDLIVLPFCQEEAGVWIDRDSTALTDEGRVTMEGLAGLTLLVRSNAHARLTEESLRDDFSQIDASPAISYRYSRSIAEFLMSTSRKDEVVLMPMGYFEHPAFGMRDDRVVASFDPPLLVTSYLAFLIPPAGNPNREAVQLLESYMRAHADRI